MIEFVCVTRGNYDLIKPKSAIVKVDAIVTYDHTEGEDEKIRCFLNDSIRVLDRVFDGRLKQIGY